MKTDYTLMIDDYLAGELDYDEMSEFEKALKMDSNLEMEVEFQKEVFAAIRDERNTLNGIRRRESKRLTISFNSWKVQAIAAAITVFILIGGGITLDLINSTPSSQTLYSEYFNPESALLTVRSNGNDYSAVEMGMLFYVQERYETAIETFNSVPDNLTGKLYTGFSYMKLEKYDKAEVQFNEIIQNNDNLFVDQAEWNLGLCYLVSGKENQAKELIAKIAQGNTVYKDKAHKLLVEMGNN